MILLVIFPKKPYEYRKSGEKSQALVSNKDTVSDKLVQIYLEKEVSI